MKRLVFSITLLGLLSFCSYAQDVKEQLAQIDTTAFKGRVFLNKAIVIKELIDPFIKQEKNKEGVKAIRLSPQYFKTLSETLERADLQGRAKPLGITAIWNRSRDETTRSNIVPIGILNSEAILLSPEQVEQNVRSKSEGKAVAASEYEGIELIAAGLLQGEIFQSNVFFQISTEYIQSNISNPIEQLEIDFQDGKGWQTYKFSDQLISHQFTSVGEVAIGIKLVTKRGTFITYNTLQIKMLKRPAVSFRASVEAEAVKNGRVAAGVTGGEYVVFNGCDGVLDKPIIIAEGIDIGQDVNIDDLLAKYYDWLYVFRNHGYDLVFVNYNDGRDYIQNNAQVLKRVINAINQQTGNQPLTVIGESMSGLVARYALREMEKDGQSHYVSHFISFDAPHQGANVPPGMIALRRNLVNLTGWIAPYIYLFLGPELRAIDTPAAKQLLVHYNLDANASSDSQFGAIRQALNDLGNGGYPANCKNIALLSGSLDGIRQENAANTNTITPGSKMLGVNIFGILCNAFINVWSNNLGTREVYNGFDIGICSIIGTNSYSVTLPNNFDRLPGGWNGSFLSGNFPLDANTNARFTFVPTYSGIDYKGPLNSDGDYTFPIWNNIIDNNFQVMPSKANLTPFSAIYGERQDNNFHTNAGQIGGVWNALADQEYGLSDAEGVLNGCSLPAPPAVTHAQYRYKIGWNYNTLPSGVCKQSRYWKSSHNPNTINLAVLGGNATSNYQQFIVITGPGLYRQLNVTQFPYRAVFDYDNLPTGTYTITARRNYIGTFSGEVFSTSRTFQISGACRTVDGCPEDGEEGDLIGLLNDTNEYCYAAKANGVWIASLADGTFVPRSRLIANGVISQGAACFAETDPQVGIPGSNCPNLGSITYQRWENIGGSTAINDLLSATNYFQNGANVTQNVNIFESPTDIMDNFGTRIRGFVCPPLSGQYTFWVAGDDNSELWLSTDENPDNAQRIAYHNAWTPWREWNWYGTQQSFPVNLQANQKYYIEARAKEGSGGDNLAVGWQLPNGGFERPIPGNRLAPFSNNNPPPNCNFSASTNPSTISTTPNAPITLNASCSGGDCGGVSYQWSGNGFSSNSANASLNAPGSNGAYTYTVTLSKPGCTSSTASVTVTVNGGGGGGSFSQCIESENSPGNGPITSDPNASNGQTRGAENDHNHFVEYTVTGVPSAGSYTLTLQYYSASTAPTVQVSVTQGGSGSQTATIPNSGSWNIVHTTHAFTVSLAAGTNKVKIQGMGGGSCRQDKVCVTGGGGGNPCGNPPGAPSVSANPATVNSGQSNTLSASGCPGSVQWSNGAGSGNSVTVSPSSTTTYTATCTVNGCTSGASNGVTVTVNGGGGGGPSCLSLGDQCSGNQYEVRNYSMPLSSGGSKTVTFTYRSHEGPGTLRFVLNGTLHTVPLPQTTLSYATMTLPGTYSFNTSNSLALSSGGGYICFREICVGSSGGRIGVAEEPITDSPELTVSPNPNDGAFEARFYVEPGHQATLRVSDIQGREVWKKHLTGQGMHREAVRLPAQSVGTFILLLDKEATGSKGKADRRPTDRRPTERRPTEFKRVIVVK